MTLTLTLTHNSDPQQVCPPRATAGGFNLNSMRALGCGIQRESRSSKLDLDFGWVTFRVIALRVRVLEPLALVSSNTPAIWLSRVAPRLLSLALPPPISLSNHLHLPGSSIVGPLHREAEGDFDFPLRSDFLVKNHVVRELVLYDGPGLEFPLSRRIPPGGFS